MRWTLKVKEEREKQRSGARRDEEQRGLVELQLLQGLEPSATTSRRSELRLTSRWSR